MNHALKRDQEGLGTSRKQDVMLDEQSLALQVTKRFLYMQQLAQHTMPDACV